MRLEASLVLVGRLSVQLNCVRFVAFRRHLVGSGQVGTVLLLFHHTLLVLHSLVPKPRKCLEEDQIFIPSGRMLPPIFEH